MNPSALAGLLRRVYDEFNMVTFANRLKLQKFVYLLQAYNLNIGYQFSLYLHGPYSTELAKDGFQIQKFSEVKPVEFKDSGAEGRFNIFINLFKQHKDDVEWLEIASSLHIFSKLYPTENENDLIIRVENKNPVFSSQEDKIKKIFSEIKEFGLI